MAGRTEAECPADRAPVKEHRCLEHREREHGQRPPRCADASGGRNANATREQDDGEARVEAEELHAPLRATTKTSVKTMPTARWARKRKRIMRRAGRTGWQVERAGRAACGLTLLSSPA